MSYRNKKIHGFCHRRVAHINMHYLGKLVYKEPVIVLPKYVKHCKEEIKRKVSIDMKSVVFLAFKPLDSTTKAF